MQATREMTWFWFGFAFLIANAAAVGFYFALKLGKRWRMVAWLGCSLVIVLSSCCVPLLSREAWALRFLDGVNALCLLFKIYDAQRAPALAARMGIGRWMAYLVNWFWFVLRREPRARPRERDWARVAIDAPLMLSAVALCIGFLWFDWSRVPFALQHVVKTLAFAAATMWIGQTFAALFRLIIGPAMDPFDNPFAARTPADFWRRWNRPF